MRSGSSEVKAECDFTFIRQCYAQGITSDEVNSANGLTEKTVDLY